MTRVSRTISSVHVPSGINRFIFGQGIVIYYYNATIVEEIQQKKKKTSFTPKQGDPHSAILFILSTGTGITPLTDSSNIAATRMHFVVKSSFLVCLFVNVTLHTDGIHVLVIGVIFARFIVLRLTKTATRSLYGQQTCALY